MNKPYIPPEKINGFCRKYRIASLALFGSILTSHFTNLSDVDMLVRFETGYIPTLFDLVDMESELTTIVGRHVDLKTPNELSPYFRDEVLSSAKIIYTA
jgi:hypothetical protein